MSAPWPDARCSERVKAFLHNRVGDLYHTIDPTPLSGALQLAAIEIQAKHSQNPLGEEDFTASLLGSFAATIPWFESAFECDFIPDVDWLKYSKHSKSPQGEGSTGADFALLIHLSKQHARAAIFQAKLCENDFIKVHQISPARIKEGKLPQPQILRLVEHGLDVMGGMRTIAELDWIHYCGYASLSSFCIPLSDLNALIAEYRQADSRIRPQLEQSIADLSDKSGEPRSRETKQAAIKLWHAFDEKTVKKNDQAANLIHLLADGAATPPEQKTCGWLSLEGNSINDFVKKTSGIMRVFQARASSPSPAAESALTAVAAEANESFERHKARTALLSGRNQVATHKYKPKR